MRKPLAFKDDTLLELKILYQKFSSNEYPIILNRRLQSQLLDKFIEAWDKNRDLTINICGILLNLNENDFIWENKL